MLLLRLGFSQAAPAVRGFLEGLTGSERISLRTGGSISPTLPLLLTVAFAQSLWPSATPWTAARQLPCPSLWQHPVMVKQQELFSHTSCQKSGPREGNQQRRRKETAEESPREQRSQRPSVRPHCLLRALSLLSCAVETVVPPAGGCCEG